MKNPLTPAGIEPATFRFVAQHLSHCATAVYEKEISGYNLELTHEFITRVKNNVGTAKCKMLKKK